MKNKVLMVGPFPPTVGGITSVIDVIMNSHLTKEYDFFSFTTSRPTVGMQKDITDYSLLLKIGPRNFANSVLFTLYHLVSYPFVLITKKPQLIHIHTTDYLNFIECSAYVFAAKLFSKKIILHIHATQFEKFYYHSHAVMRALIRKTLAMSDKVVVLSSGTKNFFETISPSTNIVVITNTTNIPDKHDERCSQEVKVLFVGSEEAKRKGLFDVIKAIPIVIEKSKSSVTFLFAGIYDGEKLNAINQAKNRCRCVSCLGFLSKKELLHVRLTSDIYVLPSYAEGLPVALLEAMAAGLPVISTKVGSIPEVVENNVNGFLIEPGDFTSLAEKIVELANDRELRQTMGERNIGKITKLFSSEHIMEELNQVYRDVFAVIKK